MPILTVLMIAFVSLVGHPQAAPATRPGGQPDWQQVGQLCGTVELVTPTKKTIIVAGKTEVNLYSTPVRHAEVSLYRASASDRTCCGSTGPVGRTQSDKFGRFELPGFPRGLYWLNVKKGNLVWAIPLRVTDDFSAQTCRAGYIGRSFIVDAQPPRVETRIY